MATILMIDPAPIGAGASSQLLVGPGGFDTVTGHSVVADTDGKVCLRDDNGTWTKNVNGAEFTVGIEIRREDTGGGNTEWIEFRNASAQILFAVYMRSDGVLEVRRGSTVLDTFATNIVRSDRVFIEFSWLGHDSTGAYEGKVDGTVEVADTNVDTLNATGPCTVIAVHNNNFGSKDTFARAIYATDGYQEYLGPGEPTFIPAAGDNGTNEWTRSTGAGDHYTHVNEVPFDDGAENLETSTSTATEDYDGGAIPVAGIPKVVARWSMAQRPAGGSGTHRLDIVSNSTPAAGSAKTPKNGSYGVSLEYFDEDPDGGGQPWTRSAVEALIYREVYP